MKRINNYYIKQLTEEQVVIIGIVQHLIELRDDLTYDDWSRSDISKLLFELCCKLLFFLFILYCIFCTAYVPLIYHFWVWNKPLNLNLLATENYFLEVLKQILQWIWTYQVSLCMWYWANISGDIFRKSAVQ